MKLICRVLSVALIVPLAQAGQLYVGAASTSITPEEPVALSGQMHTRIANTVDTPVTANALALETRNGDAVEDGTGNAIEDGTGNAIEDQAIMVSCDLVAIREGIIDNVRAKLAESIPDFDPRKLILSATHTHTAPVLEQHAYLLPDDGIIQPDAYVAFLEDRIAEAAVAAWNARKPGKAGWGLGHAIVAQNRRSVYADGRAQMYGPTDTPDFRGFEGGEDHGVEVLCFWDEADTLIATGVNVSCPAQEVEGLSSVNADFWHNIRQHLKAEHGDGLVVLGWIGAAGDQSPHLMYRKAAEERMRALRGVDRLEEIALRVIAAWNEAYAGARKEQHADLPLTHTVTPIELPLRQITEAEYTAVKASFAESAQDPNRQRKTLWHQDAVDRYERQQAGTSNPYEMELHALRLGDVAIATNDFELFTNFGIQMKARSRALQTFVIQLAGPGTYVPTAIAVQGGGYSAVVESNVVGAEGGQVLTEKTIEAINALWPQE